MLFKLLFLNLIIQSTTSPEVKFSSNKPTTTKNNKIVAEEIPPPLLGFGALFFCFFLSDIVGKCDFYLWKLYPFDATIKL